jgi:hypothetical protein
MPSEIRERDDGRFEVVIGGLVQRICRTMDDAVGLGMMTRSGGQLAVAHGAQFPAQRLLGDADPELLPDPLAQIDQPPAHHAINRRGRASTFHRSRSCATSRPGKMRDRLRERFTTIRRAVM